MATALDVRARATALRMIQKYGKPITYTRIVSGAYDPATGTAAETPTNHSIKAMVRGISPREADGLIRPGDLSVMVAGPSLAFSPSTADQVTIDGLKYVLASEPVPTYSGELVAYWTLLVRK
jgi:hypothetical protein